MLSRVFFRASMSALTLPTRKVRVYTPFPKIQRRTVGIANSIIRTIHSKPFMLTILYSIPFSSKHFLGNIV